MVESRFRGATDTHEWLRCKLSNLDVWYNFASRGVYGNSCSIAPRSADCDISFGLVINSHYRDGYRNFIIYTWFISNAAKLCISFDTAETRIPSWRQDGSIPSAPKISKAVVIAAAIQVSRYRRAEKINIQIGQFSSKIIRLHFIAKLIQ